MKEVLQIALGTIFMLNLIVLWVMSMGYNKAFRWRHGGKKSGLPFKYYVISFVAEVILGILLLFLFY